MARTLGPTLDRVAAGAGRREPDYRIEVYDIQSTRNEAEPTTIGDIVAGNELPASVGPRDFTDDVVQATLNERGGDYVDEGVASSSLDFVVVDPLGRYEPILGTDNGWLRQGNVVRIREGDRQAPLEEWPYTFTGLLIGQPGYQDAREEGLAHIQVSCLDRAHIYLQQEITTQDYAQGTPFQSMIETIAQVDMGLDPAELNLPTLSTKITAHRSTQFVRVSPLVAIAQVMFGDGFLPRFQGDGKLGAIDGNITKTSARVYANDETLKRITRPPVKANPVSEVTVIGLADTLTKVVGQRQVLAEAGITSGFFAKESRIRIRFSEDGTQQAENTVLKVRQSVNSGVLAFGAEKYTEATAADGLALEGELLIESGFHPGIVALILATQVAASYIPDTIPGPTALQTLPIGRPLRAVVMSTINILMSQIGVGRYEILGDPVEMVFEELAVTARVDTPYLNTEVPVEISNHLLSEEADLETAALRVLRRQRAKVNVRQVEQIFDPKLEPDDVFSDRLGRKYRIASIARALVRNGQGLATFNAQEVTPGVRP